MNFFDIQFLHWQWLLLLPIVWAYLVWWHKKSVPKNQQASMINIELSATNHFYHPLTKQLIKASQSTPNTRRLLWKQTAFWLNGLIISLLLSALAQPVLIGERLQDPPPERDIVFLVDTSISMQLKDYQQQGQSIKRIDVLRNLLDEFVSKMKGEKISIILFAEKSYVLVPLSSDQNLLRQMLKRITSTLAGRYTAVGDALLMALNETKKQQAMLSTQTKNPTKRHQTFILFTDADTSRGSVTTTAAAKIIAEEGIPVFTIAIGSTQQDGERKIEGGLYHPVDLALLKAISEQTNGKSYQVNDVKTMQDALQNILEQRQNTALAKPIYEQESLYYYFLFIALFLLVLSQLLQLLRTILRSRQRST